MSFEGYQAYGRLKSGSSSFGRAIAFQAIGGRFEPGLPLFFKEEMLLSDCRCSSGVEHFLGREEVVSSILTNGSGYLKQNLQIVEQSKKMQCATQQ